MTAVLVYVAILGFVWTVVVVVVRFGFDCVGCLVLIVLAV